MLINCVVYQNGVKLRDIPVEDISDYICQADCFVWVALHDATTEELDKMQEEFSLHPLAMEDAHHGHQRPKVEEYGETLFVVMHLPEIIAGEMHVGEVMVFTGSNFVLSIRNRNSQHFLGVRERAERESHLLRHGSGFVLYALMDAVVDRYFPITDTLESELEAVEERIFARGSGRSNVEQLYELKQRVTALKHAVTPLMDGTRRLYGGRVPQVCINHEAYFRDVYDHLERINLLLETLRDTIGTAIQVNLSMVTIEESEVNKRLAAWAGIFAVATAFAGIWGMNFEHMPELEWIYGYPVALGAIAAACGFLYYRFKRSGWL